jgi:hypothetical protein
MNEERYLLEQADLLDMHDVKSPEKGDRKVRNTSVLK